MWSIHMVLNRLLKADEEKFDVATENHLEFVDTCNSQQSSDQDNCTGPFRSNFVEVPHVSQQYSWDCGLACVLMVLRTLGFYGCNIGDLIELCCTKSIWTVDLAYLLQKFSVNFTYCTVTFGANPNFSMERFYKDQLPNDLVRVNMLFQEAREAGINIECRSVSAKEISNSVLSGKYIAIALVDQYKLSNSQLENLYMMDFITGSSGYTGHYIVICGYDAATDEFEIRDPASSRAHERVTSLRLDQARRSFGTDEDLLLISLGDD